MKKALTIAVAAISLHVNAQPITCADSKACEKMWSNAQQAVDRLSGMPIRLLTDSRIETFPSNNPGFLAATVTKVPINDGYEIKYRFDCFRDVDCSALRTLLERRFQKMILEK